MHPINFLLLSCNENKNERDILIEEDRVLKNSEILNLTYIPSNEYLHSVIDRSETSNLRFSFQ